MLDQKINEIRYLKFRGRDSFLEKSGILPSAVWKDLAPGRGANHNEGKREHEKDKEQCSNFLISGDLLEKSHTFPK